MKPHEDRVVTEANELNDKIEKLMAFIKGDVYLSLSHADCELLLEQCHAMIRYHSALQKRIARFVP